MSRPLTPTGQHYGVWAYNARSTRPVAHYWPTSDEEYRKALCGAWAHDELLDTNVGAARECERCRAKRDTLRPSECLKS